MRRIPTIIGILVLILGTAAGIILVATSKQFKLGASPDIAPQDVRITNITESSFTVSWITDKPTIGYIKYGTSANSLNLNTTAPQTAQSIHWAQVQSLSPGSQYFFKINSGGSDFDNNGIPWTTSTGPQISQAQPSSSMLSGSVEDQGGLPAIGVVVYATIQGASPLSAYTSANGSWVIPLNTARSSDLSRYATISPDTSLIQIFVQGGIAGVSTAQAYPKGANPTPTIKLGQIYDFRNQVSSAPGENPSTTLNLPTSTGSGSFNLNQIASTSGAPKAVAVTSIKNGEVITTTKPQIIGSGTPGTKITLTIKSTPQTATVTVGANGTWVWTPPSNLEPGTHTLTVSWTDASGILQTLTRTFVVSAASGPAFVSTPSASPIATLGGTLLPTPTPSSTLSGVTRVTLPATAGAVPVSGTLTPTLALSMMGIGLVVSSFILWKKIEI